MAIITLPAHYDGKQICLDEAYDLEPNARLIVTLLPTEKSDEEHERWLTLSNQKLEQAYGENEPEYSENLIKEVNVDYEAG